MQAERIIGIKKIGKLRTIDIEVNNDNHVFYGNGIAVSNSHSVAYAIRGYKTAYIKSHFPLAFYTSKLAGAKFKIDMVSSISDLINECKLFNIKVKCPDIRDKRKFFHTDGKVIKFGLCDIKGIGESTLNKIKPTLTNIPASFTEFALDIALPFIPDSAVLKIIESGACDFFKLSRSKMLAEYKVLSELNLTMKDGKACGERPLLFEFWKSNRFTDTILLFKKTFKLKKEGGIFSTKKRLELFESHLKLLENPIQPYVDNPVWIVHTEETLLGYPITYQKIDSCDTSQVNTTCKEYLAGKNGFILMGVDIKEVMEKEIKRGKNKGNKFGSLKISDASCSMDAVAWSETWNDYRGLLTEGNSVIVQGERPYKNKNNNLVIKRVWQAK